MKSEGAIAAQPAFLLLRTKSRAGNFQEKHLAG
jgi:hypothetical protein